MVMLFYYSNVLDYLLKNKEVYTFRKNKHKEGYDWITNKRNGNKIANVEIKLELEPKFPLELLPYVTKSGFVNLFTWLQAIYKLTNKKCSLDLDCDDCVYGGYLYHVKLC